MMNFMMQKGMNQMKDQAQGFIPKDMKENNQENQNKPEEGKIENSGEKSQSQPLQPPKKKNQK